MNVRTMIKRPRQRLCHIGLSDQLIESRPRIGYCWHDPEATANGAAANLDRKVALYPLAISLPCWKRMAQHH